MAESMIERVAHAAENAVLNPHAHGCSVSIIGDPARFYDAISRAIIAAMRDFTEEMDLRQFGYDGREPICMIDRSADEVWQWAIDQALDGA